ncbi:hypothetical protein KJR29_09355, partial [Streptococcus lutetiensis]
GASGKATKACQENQVLTGKRPISTWPMQNRQTAELVLALRNLANSIKDITPISHKRAVQTQLNIRGWTDALVLKLVDEIFGFNRKLLVVS